LQKSCGSDFFKKIAAAFPITSCHSERLFYCHSERLPALPTGRQAIGRLAKNPSVSWHGILRLCPQDDKRRAGMGSFGLCPQDDEKFSG